MQVLNQRLAQDPTPTLDWNQLLRSCAQALEEGDDKSVVTLNLLGFGMRARDGQLCLI